MGVELSTQGVEKQDNGSFKWRDWQINFRSNSPDGCNTRMVEITEGAEIHKIPVEMWESVVELDEYVTEKHGEKDMLVVVDKDAKNYLRLMQSRDWLLITSGEVQIEDEVMKFGKTSSPVKIPKHGRVIIELDKQAKKLNAKRDR